MADRHPKSLLTADEVADRLGISRRSVDRLRKSWGLPAFKIGGMGEVPTAGCGRLRRPAHAERPGGSNRHPDEAEPSAGAGTIEHPGRPSSTTRAAASGTTGVGPPGERRHQRCYSMRPRGVVERVVPSGFEPLASAV
ncbi:MAG TPA: helix-turn-helix domain-containing protein [Actinomycetota bacterium]|nr:helix-turn-helix domain-containing protein [Actinomycetota bacterium]